MRAQLKQLGGDTAIYGVTTIVQRFLSFILTPFYTHFLTPRELGVQADLFVIIAFLLVLANAGMESAYFKHDAAAKTDEERRTVLWNAVGVNWIVAITFGLLMALFPRGASAVTLLNLPEEYIGLIPLVGAVLALDSMSMIPLALLRMRRRAFKYGTIKVASIVVNVILNVILVGLLDMKLTGIFIAALAQSLTQFLLSVPFLRFLKPIRFDPRLRRQMLAFGLPTLGSGLSLIALQLIDRPIFKQLAGYEALGLYQANFRLAIVMVVMNAVFEFAWRPFFLQQAEKPNAQALFARVFTYFNVIGGGLVVAVALFIANVAAIPIPFTDATFIAPLYWSGLTIVPIVLVAYLFNGWYTNFIVGVYVEGKTKALLWLTLGGAIAKALLCIALIPIIGIAGGAWGTFGAYLLMSLALLVISQKFFPIPYEWGRVLLVLTGVAGILLLAELLFETTDQSFRTFAFKVGLMLLYPLWLFVTGFFSAGERKEMSRLLGMMKRRGG